MRIDFIKMGLLTSLSLVSALAFAEPAIQSGETLESLSKVKVTTTVNGQPGSIKELVDSGKVKLLSDQSPAVEKTSSAPTVTKTTEPQANAPVTTTPAQVEESSAVSEKSNTSTEAPQAKTTATQ